MKIFVNIWYQPLQCSFKKQCIFCWFKLISFLTWTNKTYVSLIYVFLWDLLQTVLSSIVDNLESSRYIKLQSCFCLLTKGHVLIQWLGFGLLYICCGMEEHYPIRSGRPFMCEVLTPFSNVSIYIQIPTQCSTFEIRHSP